MNRLSFIDLAFFLTETEASPKHVAGLSIFERPKGSKASWVKSFYNELRSHQEFQPPFNQVIKFSPGRAQWKTVNAVNIDEHLAYHKPAKTLSETELFNYAAKLHEPLLDREKPLWEFHVIDKIAGNRFAIYSKIHHAYADGITISRWMMSTMSPSVRGNTSAAIWEMRNTGASIHNKADQGLLNSTLHTARQSGAVFAGISKLLAQLVLEQVGLTKNAVALPFKAKEKTPLTGKVTADRQFASAKISMEEIGNIRATTRCTLNHIALTCIDGALRNYLADQGIKLERPFSIQMPVNLREKSDTSSGNKIGMVLVDLAPPDSVDPYTRLREIGFTLRAVRNQIDGVPAIAVAQYTGVMAVLIELSQLLQLHKYLPAVSDTLVSNVPGPEKPLYMNGARLQQSLPISTLPPGGQLNITLYSYAGTLYFGLVASNKVVNLDSLAKYIEAAFVELNSAVYC